MGKCLSWRLTLPTFGAASGVSSVSSVCQFVLDVVHDVAVDGLVVVGIHHQKTVQRVTVLGGVHLGFHDVVAHVREEAADAREQVRFVLRIDQHLQAFADAAQARLDDGFVAVHAMCQHARVPRDLVRFVAQEIVGVELGPQQFVHFGMNGVQGERLGCALTDLAHLVGDLAAGQEAPGRIVEVFQQLAPSRHSRLWRWCRECRQP